MTTPELTLGWLRLGKNNRTGADTAGPRARARKPVLRASGPLVEVLVVVVSALDVLLAMLIELDNLKGEDPSLPYSAALSILACAVLPARHRFPFITLVLTVPGFFAGWVQLASMIALYSLARRWHLGWQTLLGAALVAISRFVLWPLDDFLATTWMEHGLNVIWSCVVAGLPVALGLLVTARQELNERYTELKRGKEREQRLHAIAVREQERSRLAREMHDGVSHQVTLIAMQAGALKVSAPDEDTERSADTIRELSLSTLSELREMVGLLRTTGSEDERGCQPCLNELDELLSGAEIRVELNRREIPEQLPPEVSVAAYRTVQEALTNVYKHAPGASASIDLHAEQDALLVEVRNGAPAHPPASLPSGGYGLAGLAERAEQLGGSLETEATDDGGFGLRARYPLLT